MSLGGDQLYAIALVAWAIVTVLALLGGAWLRAQLRGEEDLEPGQQLADTQIDPDEYRARVSLIQP